MNLSNRIHISCLFICLVSMPAFSQETNPTNQKDEFKAEPSRSAGLKKITNRSEYYGRDIHIDEEMETNIALTIENVMKSVEAALENLEIKIESIEIDIPNIDFDIEPIDLDFEEMDININENHFDWVNDADAGLSFDKDKNKEKDKLKDKSDKEDKENKDKAKGLKKIN